MSRYYLGRNNQKFGPYAHGELVKHAAAGFIVPTDMLLQDGARKWVQASSITGVFPSTSHARVRYRKVVVVGIAALGVMATAIVYYATKRHADREPITHFPSTASVSSGTKTDVPSTPRAGSPAQVENNKSRSSPVSKQADRGATNSSAPSTPRARPEPREEVRDFESDVTKAGFDVSPVGVHKFVRYRSLEQLKRKDRNDLPLNDPAVSNAVYRFKTPLLRESAHLYFGLGRSSSFIAARLPFRPYFDPNSVQSAEFEKIVPFWAEWRSKWFLTKDMTLIKCQNDAEARLVVQKGGYIYYADAVFSTHLMIKLSGHESDPFVREYKPSVVVEFDQLRYSPPETWGFYKANALANEFDRYDCAAIHRAHDLGLDVESMPAFFESDRDKPDQLLGARIRQIKVVAESGKELGTAFMPDGNN